MEINEAKNAIIDSTLFWNDTKIKLEKECTYLIFTDPEDQIWTDGKRWPQRCNANGFSHRLLNLFSFLKRHRPSRWFCLIGSIDKAKSTYFSIGIKTEYTPELSGTLHCFANDAKSHYNNNSGSIKIKIKRID